MTEITTQGIVERINSTTIQSIQLKGKIAEVKQRLAEYPEKLPKKERILPDELKNMVF